jgi:hypothetical protein
VIDGCATELFVGKQNMALATPICPAPRRVPPVAGGFVFKRVGRRPLSSLPRPRQYGISLGLGGNAMAQVAHDQITKP